MSQQEDFQGGYSAMGGEEEGISIAELLHIFRQRFWWFVLGLVVVMALAVGYLKVAVPEYESQVSVLVDPIQKSSSIENLLDSSTSSTKIATEVELITSVRNIEYALSTMDLNSYHNADGQGYDDPDILGAVKNRIVVSTVKDTNIVRITVTDANPKFAQDLANALASSYDNLLTGIAKNSKTAQREFIESQIPINDASLTHASDSLGEFRENSNIIQLTDKSSMLVEQISYYTSRLEPLQLQLKESMVFIDSYLAQLKSAGTKNLLTIDQIRADGIVAEKLKDLAASKTELTMYESLATPTTVGITASTANTLDSTGRTYILSSGISQLTKELLDRVNLLTQNYANDANTQAIVQALTTEVGIKVLQERGDVFVMELSELPILERQLSELERDVQVYEAIGLKLRDMLEEVKLVEAAVTGNVTVVDAAKIPMNPVSPNKLLILAVAMLLGCAVGLLLTLLIETLDTSIRTEHQILKIVGSDIPLLGWIPLMKISSKDMYPTLTVYNDPLSFESERFKLVANMLYNKDHSKVFSITSCSMAEGKSTIIGNISLALAQMGSKVLVIDGDLRLPSMERFFRLTHRNVGLVDYITKKVSTLEECILQPFDKVPNLHLLAPGNAPLVPAAIFSNPRYTEMIKELEQVYDFIIIDAPPLDSASELLSISKHVDGLIITVRAGVTAKGSLFDLMTNLKTAEVPITGVVFNGVIPGTTGSYRYGYGYSYGYRYGSYSYRYATYGGDAKGQKSKHHRKKRSTAWYRKRYKQDLKLRGKITTEQFSPVLAFSETGDNKSLHVWATDTMYNPITGLTEKIVAPQKEVPTKVKAMVEPQKEVVKEVKTVIEPRVVISTGKESDFDALSLIEGDILSSGKKEEV